MTWTGGRLPFEQSMRHCGHCEQDSVYGVDHYMQGPQHDACIHELPKVASACCGHGAKRGHVRLEDTEFTVYFPTGVKGYVIRAVVQAYNETGYLPAWVKTVPDETLYEDHQHGGH